MKESVAFTIIITMVIAISILGPLFITKRIEQITMNREGITGAATNVDVSFTLLKAMDLTQLNFTAELSWVDNATVILSWKNISADNYSIWISDNITWIMNGSAYGPPNVPGLTGFN